MQKGIVVLLTEQAEKKVSCVLGHPIKRPIISGGPVFRHPIKYYKVRTALVLGREEEVVGDSGEERKKKSALP